MNEVVIMPDQEKRSIDEIMEDLQRINQEFRERVRDGFKNPDDFIKLSEIEKLGRELSLNTQKLYLEETTSLLNDIDESLLIRKKKQSTRKCLRHINSPSPSFMRGIRGFHFFPF